MTPDELSRAIKAKLHPTPYGRDVRPSGPFDFLIMRSSALPGGRYAFAFRRLGADSVRETYERSRADARSLTRGVWLFREVGLYLMLCGPQASWHGRTEHAPVDKTGLRRIIVQVVHFVDPETGAEHLNRSHWGPVQFGGLIPISALVEEVIRRIPNSSLEANDARRESRRC
jgi:hypothetical protein